MFSTPILFIIFNRPDTTKKVFESIRSVKPNKLYVAADAPRAGNSNDENKCREARSIIEQVDWPCEVKKLYIEKNIGCYEAVSGALNWFFTEEEMGIIVEDDCLANSDFYIFCEEMLHRFKNNKKIISINGSNLGYKLNNGKSYTFSRFMNMWGWATWRRSVQSVDYKLHDWKNKKHPLLFLHSRLKQHFFDADINWYKYWEEKFNTIAFSKDVPTWDWQWIFNQLEHQKLSIIPAVNLVTNIGFNFDATHTHIADNPAANLPVFPILYPINHPQKIEIDNYYEEEHVKKVWCYYKRLSKTFYIKKYIKQFIPFLK